MQDASPGLTHQRLRALHAAFNADGLIVDRRRRDAAAERRGLALGLLAKPASIEPKYLYDTVGCELFAAICRLPEYYPTRTEASIFERHREDIADVAGIGRQFVDLGAGDCAKAAQWVATLAPRRYVAVDIADDALAPALVRLARKHPAIDVRGVLTDFTRGLDLTRDLADGPTTFFYPGSSIGNFAPADAAAFLRAIQRYCTLDEGSGLLIGVDTRKDAKRLRAAYDDTAGITAAFNRNILSHVNRVLDTAFAPVAFDHVALYSETDSRVEMHLQARAAQTVTIDGVARKFERGERIHTENSYKYAPAQFSAMLERAGFGDVRCWQDDAGDFAVYYAS